MPEEEAGWVMPTIVFGGVNLLLLIGGLGFWLLWRRRRGDDEIGLLDDMDTDSPEPAAAESDEVAEKG
jgi:hypothetical protein